MKIHITAATDCGGQTLNQDRILINHKIMMQGRTETTVKEKAKGVRVCAVADGVTHCEDGALAAVTALKSLNNNTEILKTHLQECQLKKDSSEFFSDVRDLIRQINTDVVSLSKNKSRSIYATTLSLFAYCNGKLVTSSVGDSPILLLRNGQCYIMNDKYVGSEHIARMDDIGRLASERNVLDAYIGNPNEEIPYSYCVEMQALPGDQYLIASDGITGVLTLQEIIDALRSPKKDKASELIRLVKSIDCEYVDNISAIVIEVI